MKSLRKFSLTEKFATAITSNDVEEVQKFLDQAVDVSCEGLIIKTLNEDATYEPSKRSLNWLKLKKDYIENIGDSLDLVPVAAFHGHGERTGVYGAFLLACYDNNNEEFQSICKIGTGFSEEMLEQQFASLRSRVIPKPKTYYRYAETINPNVWFETSEVHQLMLLSFFYFIIVQNNSKLLIALVATCSRFGTHCVELSLDFSQHVRSTLASIIM
ncbi:hypothetical protein RIF29_14816 [Crotalaria pallida]|uniref:ATP-dependent DNA ligase family profile domain-containing protein n=1 Tax=Crotalaria pallida TaxID=3830 RepID=A0AAN9FKT5_CROPI